MYRDYTEHRRYLDSDIKRFKGGKPGFKEYLFHEENWFIWKFLYHLRCVEYHKGKCGAHKLLFLWHYFFYKRLSWKLKWRISPYSLGPGAHAYHVGDFVYIGNKVKIGANFTFQNGVVIDAQMNVIIGNNVELNQGVKIVKSINIGNNVIVGANSIVTHDLPDNAIAVGIPARVIKFRDENTSN